MWPDRVLNPGPLMPYRLAYTAWRKMLRDQLNSICGFFSLTLLHSEWPKLLGVLAVLSAIGLNGIEFWPFRVQYG